MPIRVFTVQEREMLRIKMLDAGFELIKTYGMTHASIAKITRAINVGKSTFYNFFDCKESFVIEIIQYQRDQMRQYFNELLNGREKMSTEQAKTYFKKSIFSADSIYQYLTDQDEQQLMAYISQSGLNEKFEDSTQSTMSTLLSHMENVRPNVDWKLAANLMRIAAFARLHRRELYEEAMQQTMESICQQVFDCLFEEKA